MSSISNRLITLLEDGEWSPSSLSVLVSTLFLGTGLLVWHNWPASVRDIREPPVLRPNIPYIGHLLGMIVHQAEYLQILAKRTGSPIFALKILSGEIYVITSPSLVQAIFRSPKIFSFDSISIDASRKIFGFTDRQMEILSVGKTPDSDVYPLAKEVTSEMHKTLQASDALLVMNTRALNRFATFLNPIGAKEKTVRLLAWVRDCFTIATTEALYGPINPISEDNSLIQSLQDFESALGLLYLNFLPSLTATAGHRARLDFAQAFKRYYDNNHHLNASAIIQARYKTQKAGGFTSDDIASFDIGLMLASTMNSIPAVFWLLTNIYSSPSLLASLRTELAPIFTVNEGKATLSVSALNTKCPLLVSTWQETLRLTDATVSARMVTEDTLLDNQYFLKKGAFIQLACGPMHTSPSIWGSSSTSFVPSRFTPSSVATLSKDEKKQRKAGYAPFGGGVVLCPGRYFATTEILGVVATMVMGYEITSAHGVALHVPAMEKQKMSVQVKHPVGDLDVCIVRRQGWEEVMWGYELGSSGSGSGDNGEEGGVFG